jgi:hypothetical protein
MISTQPDADRQSESGETQDFVPSSTIAPQDIAGELPSGQQPADSAITAAEIAQVLGLPNEERTFIPEVDGFRAVLITLLPLLTNGGKQ